MSSRERREAQPGERDAPTLAGEPAERRGGWLRVWITAGSLLALLTLPWMITNPEGTRAAFDQREFHWPVIERFARDFPAVDLRNYESATTPGYHLVLATVKAIGVESLVAIKAVAWLFGLALCGAAAAAVSTARDRWWVGAIAVLPLACSSYVQHSAAWLLPDNAGWLGVALLVAMALRRPLTVRTLVAAGVTLVALVWVRQIHIWAITPIWVAAWLDATASRSGRVTDLPPIEPRGELGWLFSHPRARAIGLLMAIAFSLPAFGVLAWFHSLWGGLVPPMFQQQHGAAFRAAAPMFGMALLGVFGVFYVGWWGPALLDAYRRASLRTRLLYASVPIAMAIATAIPRKGFSTEEGRFSGLWRVVQLVPEVAARSPLLILLAAAGSIVAMGLFAMLERRERWIIAGAWLGFLAAQSVNPMVWQRYFEPFVLLVLAVSVTHPSLAARSRIARWASVGPIALAVGLAALSQWLAFNGLRAEPASGRSSGQGAIWTTTPE